MGPNFLEVVAPVREGSSAGRYLERRQGDGGYMVILQCDNALERRARMAEIGVRIINSLEYGDFLGTQLHPGDTGGAMLETDQTQGDQGPEGAWHPAGPDWRGAVRTERTEAMVGAELQAEDPDALAARWAEILNRPLSEGRGGTEIQLDNAVLRFVEAEDGRGEGLGGVDLVARDRAAILNAAKTRNCAVVGDAVTVCGTRFRLT